ncbi:MAG: amidoligase family protein [Fischerella sp.]|nr:amidoligase family protein [Fischerella sp.]
MRIKDILSEVNMSPGALQDFVNSPQAQGMLAGFEAELIFVGALNNEDASLEHNEEIPEDIDIQTIASFFMLNKNSRIIQELLDNFYSYLTDKANREARRRARSGVKDDEIKELMKEDGLSDEEIDAAFENNDISDYEERWLEIVQENIYENTTLYQYLTDELSINYYSDFVEHGFEWPYASDEDFNKESAKEIAFSMSRALGRAPWRVSGEYHSVKRDEDTWILEPDSSIEPDNAGDMGVEIISPPMPLKKTLEILPKFLTWAKNNNGYTNESTGFHMGVSLPEQSTEKIDYVKLALFLGDKYVLEQFDRISNSYTKSTLKNIEDHIKSADINNLSQYMINMRDNMIAEVSRAIEQSLLKDRRVSINMKHNYIEFRSAGGDYIEKIPELVNTMMRYARAMSIAADPDAYKQEYQKKLYKLLTSKFQGNDRVEKFATWISQAVNSSTEESKKTAKDMLKYIQQNVELTRPIPGQEPPKPLQTINQNDKLSMPKWRVGDGINSVLIRAPDEELARQYAMQNLQSVLNTNRPLQVVPIK